VKLSPPDRKSSQHFRASVNSSKLIPFFVMAGLVPAIHAFLAVMEQGRGCPGQGRARRAGSQCPDLL